MHREDEIVLMILCSVFLGGWGLIISFVLFKRWMLWMRGGVVSYDDIPLPGVEAFGGRDVSCTCENACIRHERQPESVVVGSNFTKVNITKVPKVQLPLYSVDENGRLVNFLGNGVRILDWLVVPYHVIVAQTTVAGLVMKPNQISESIKFDVSKFELIEGDVAAIKLSEATFSRLGLVKAQCCSIDGEMMVAICSATKDPEISFGTLVNDKAVFGGVVYRGSTRGGFSGAAYMMGRQIAGIHLGGGVMNYGVSATYVQALLQKPEDTSEWLERIRQKEGPLTYQRSKFNPDEAVVFVRGRYHNVDLSLLEDDIEGENKNSSYLVGGVLKRIGEINVSQNFPPQYLDIVEPIAETITSAVEEVQSKNLELAEQCSAAQAELYMKRHTELIQQLDERMLLLQGLQNSAADRYREVSKLLQEAPKGTEGRVILVKENEKLKTELSEIKQLKTFANVEVSSLKAVPKIVRKAIAKRDGATMLERISASGFVVEDVIQTLVDLGLVLRVVEGHVKIVDSTTVKDVHEPSMKSTKVLPKITIE